MDSYIRAAFFSLIILWMNFSSLYPQNHEIKFEHITTEQGLASNTVYDIIQDRYGFMWFGTSDGLCRYDGYKIKVFRYDPLDSNSISSSWASRLYEDRSGNIWIGTVRGGISRFDPKTEKFIRYEHDPDNPTSIMNDTAFGIGEDTLGTLWIGTWSGLEQLILSTDSATNREKSEFIHYRYDSDNPNSLSDTRIWQLYIDRSNMIWIATQDGGLNKFDIAAGKFTHYKNDPQNSNSISHNTVRFIYEDPEGNGNILWIGTYGGLNRLNKKSEYFTHFRHDPANPSSLSHDLVIPIYKDKQGALWIGTKGGLNKLDFKIVDDDHKALLPVITRYQHDSTNIHSLNKDFVFAICEDQSGVLWLGTIGGGVNRVSDELKKFNVNRFPVSIRSIYEDADGLMWFGTLNGFYKCDLKNNNTVHFVNQPGVENSLYFNNIHCLLEDPHYKNKTFWIACYGGGLDRIVFDDYGQSYQFSHFRSDPDDTLSLNDDCVDCLYLDCSGRLWIGTCEGLSLFDRATEAFTNFVHDPANPYSISGEAVTTIYQAAGDSNVLWVGTGNGLNKFDIDTKIFIRYQHNPADSNSLGYDYIHTIYADSWNKGDVLWLGTFGGGLDKFDLKTEKFTHFTEADGLMNNTISSIVEDDHGYLWISTKTGISKFNIQSETFRNYGSDHGVDRLGFSRGAFFKNGKGEIFFAGNVGFVHFHPDSIIDNPNIPPIVVTDFKIFDRSVKLEQSIHTINKIKLSHKQNFFSLDFAALDYRNPRKNQYSYRLEGVDPQWVYCGNRQYVYYTNVKPGNYIFRVKGSNNDGIWNEQGTSIKIIITPPFWKTWWFYSLLGFFTLGIMGWGYHFRLSLLIKERNTQQAFSRRLIEEVEKGRKRIARELHDGLGQNLLIIKNELHQAILSRAPQKGKTEDLANISTKVSDSIHEVREISTDLHPHQLDRLGLTEAIGSVIEKFSETFSQIKFVSELANIDNLLPSDLKIHIFRIIQEGLNNIVKHANCTRAIVQIKKTDKFVNILIKDNGCGFDFRRYAIGRTGHQGFGLSGIAERVKILKGKLVIDSEPGRGTEIQIQLKIKP